MTDRRDPGTIAGLRKRVIAAIVPIVVLGLMVGVLVWQGARGGAVEHVERPHVVLITLDTIRADHLGCYGYARPTSPNIDRFAEHAVRYQRSIATAPWTLPSHASMFTGLYPHEHGARSFKVSDRRQNNARPLPRAHTRLAEVLQRLGYRTAAFVANNVYLTKRWNLHQGFDEYRVERQRASGVNRDTLRWLASQDEQPFFLFVNYMDAHRPYNTASGPSQVDWDVPRDRSLLNQLIDDAMTGDGKADPALREAVVAQYDNAIAHVDRAVGQLLSALDEAGHGDRALIVVTSDHGEYFGEHRLVEHSKDVYEGAVRVPLLIREPGRHRGRSDGTPVTSAHLPRMILERIPAARRELEHFPRRAGDEPILSENYFTRTKDLLHPVWGHRFNRVRTAIYDLPLKLIHSTRDEPELYDIERDPRERHDLAPSQPDKAAELVRRIPDSLRREDAGGDPAQGEAAPELTPREIRNLRALGYME